MMLSRWAAFRARAVIAVSKEILQGLPRSCRDRARLLPMGVDLARFTAVPREEACRALDFDPAVRRVLFAADPARAVKRWALAEAAVGRVRERHPGVELVVARGAPPERMPLMMSACDALVLTSRHEGSPMVVKEALACGLPIVSVAVGDVAERIAGVAGCRLVAAEPAAIADALGEVLARGGRTEGRSHVEPLALERVAAELVSVYRSVVSA